MSQNEHDDAWMFEPLDEEERAAARIKRELEDIEEELGTKRQAGDNVGNSKKKSKQGAPKTKQERKS